MLRLLKSSFLHNIKKDPRGAEIQDVDFPRFISLIMDNCLGDLIHFSEATWVVVIGVFLFHALTTGLGKYGIASAEYQFSILCTFLPPVLALNLRNFMTQELIEVGSEAKNGNLEYEATDNCCKCMSMIDVIHTLQAALFMMSYSLARRVAHKGFWHLKQPTGDSIDMAEAIIELVIDIFFWIWIAFWLVPDAVAACAGLPVMPNFMEDDHWGILEACQTHAKTLRERAELNPDAAAGAGLAPATEPEAAAENHPFEVAVGP